MTRWATFTLEDGRTVQYDACTRVTVIKQLDGSRHSQYPEDVRVGDTLVLWPDVRYHRVELRHITGRSFHDVDL